MTPQAELDFHRARCVDAMQRRNPPLTVSEDKIAVLCKWSRVDYATQTITSPETGLPVIQQIPVIRVVDEHGEIRLHGVRHEPLTLTELIELVQSWRQSPSAALKADAMVFYS